MQVHDEGFIRLVDSMGDDNAIVQAARVSYGEGSKGEKADEKLIKYLINNKHTSPFEQVQLKFHIKAPIFVARQWMRHRTGSFNEISGRYTEAADRFYTPSRDNITTQDTKNRQARTSEQVRQTTICRIEFEKAYHAAYASYKKLLDEGVARELARIVLPLATYTEFYWSVNLHNLLHFISLRGDEHAQKEIRDYAQVLLWLAESVAPVAVKAYREHQS